MKDTIIFIAVAAITPFAFYFLFAFVVWIVNDPFNIIATPEWRERSTWNTCALQAEYIFRDMNDTWGSTYALEDTPSKSVQDFMRMCMEENKK